MAYKKVILVAISMLILTSNITVKAEENISKCDSLWSKFSSYENQLLVDQKLASWEKIKGKCDLGAYTYGLARLLTEAKQYERVRVIIDEVLSDKIDFYRELQLARLNSYFHEYAYNDVKDNDKWRNLAKDYIDLSKRYPDWYGGYLGAGGVFLAAKVPDVAIKYSKLANEQQETSNAYRNLAVAYYDKQAFLLAEENAAKSHYLDNNIIMDKNLMLVWSVAATKNGNYEQSKIILASLLSYHEDIESDEGFLAAGNFLSKTMQESREP